MEGIFFGGLQYATKVAPEFSKLLHFCFTVTVSNPYTLRRRTRIGIQIGIIFFIFILLLFFLWDMLNFWKELILTATTLYIQLKTTKKWKRKFKMGNKNILNYVCTVRIYSPNK